MMAAVGASLDTAAGDRDNCSVSMTTAADVSVDTAAGDRVEGPAVL